MHRLRLTCTTFHIDVRVGKVGDRWLASADTPDGPSLGWGHHSVQAIMMALEPFDSPIEELLQGASFVDSRALAEQMATGELEGIVLKHTAAPSRDGKRGASSKVKDPSWHEREA
jgi:hypothetical protein